MRTTYAMNALQSRVSSNETVVLAPRPSPREPNRRLLRTQPASRLARLKAAASWQLTAVPELVVVVVVVLCWAMLTELCLLENMTRRQ